MELCLFLYWWDVCFLVDKHGLGPLTLALSLEGSPHLGKEKRTFDILVLTSNAKCKMNETCNVL